MNERGEPMTHDEIAELLGAYALDAVEGDELAAVEDHLVDCARCRAEVREHREVAALLAHGGAAAPDGLWQRIADALEEAPPGLRLAPVEPRPDEPAAARSRWAGARRWWPAVLAAAAAVVVVAALGAQVRDQDRRIDELQAAAENPLVPAFSAALEDPATEVFELRSTDGDLALRAAITDDGRGYLRATGLPRLEPGRTYQLWGMAGEQVVSLAILGPEPHVVTFAGSDFAGFAITEEAAPGAVAPTALPLVAGQLD
jgi:anti-sigma-K factor RskA